MEHPTNDKEILDILSSLQKLRDDRNYYYGVFPYEWAKIPDSIHVNVFLDTGLNLKYVIMDGKKLYFPKKWNDEEIRLYYHKTQSIEQHSSSPHNYFTSSFNASPNDIAVDFGSAEGNWSLSIVETVKKLYIFEPSDEWDEPLKATFLPWEKKVIFVKKFISNHIDENTTSIDEYFKDKELPTLLKFDIEGFEKQALLGGKKTFSENFGMKILICTYHKENDEKELSQLMEIYGFTITHSDGYMLFFGYDELKPPYFRRGLIRCSKILT